MKTIVANWKMNLGVKESVALARAVARGVARMKQAPQVMVAPSAPCLVSVAAALKRSKVRVVAQAVSGYENGAFTGDVSAAQVKEAGADSVIVGHSERRLLHNEGDAVVRDQLVCALAEGLDVVLCVGESHASREAGDANGFVTDQLRHVLTDVNVGRHARLYVAYEPVWAIGAGVLPALQDIVDMAEHIRQELQGIGVEAAVLYGGSVTPETAYPLLHHSALDGVLVGGAGQKSSSLLEIIRMTA